MGICARDSLKLALAAGLLLCAAVAQAGEPCLSTAPSPRLRNELVSQASELLRGEVVLEDSLRYCRFGAYSEASIGARVVVDEHGLGTKKWVSCRQPHRIRPALWECKLQNVPVMLVPVIIDGHPRSLTARVPPTLAPAIIRELVPRLIELAQTATPANSCSSNAGDNYLKQLRRDFLGERDEELYFYFEQGVLRVWRGDSRLSLHPPAQSAIAVARGDSPLTFELAAQEAAQFEYLCWDAFDTL